MRGKFSAIWLSFAFLVFAPFGVASAGPYCYETGPGYQKCVDGSTGGYQDPIYQGPKIYDGGNVPWVPSAPAPVYIPAPPVAAVPDDGVLIPSLANHVQSSIQGFFDDPANGKTQYNLHAGTEAS